MRVRAPSDRSAGALLPVAVACAAVAAFLPALRGGFVWDDAFYLAPDSPVRAHGLAAVSRIASSFVLGNYHPLTVASLALDQALGGGGPLVFHATNLALHAVNAVLVGLLLIALGGSRASAWAAAALWAVHPLRVEPVAWISGRKDLLYACFFLLALLAYVRHVRRERALGRAWAASLALFALSAASKAMAVALVPVLFLVDWLLARPLSRRSIAEKVPFAAVGLAVGLVALAAQRSAGAVGIAPSYAVASRVALAAYAVALYLAKTAAPVGLSAFYPYPTAPSGTLPAIAVAAALATAALATAVTWSVRRTRGVAFGAAFFLVMLLLVLQIMPVGGAIAADRYTYVASVGLAYLAALALERIPPRAGATVSVTAALVLGGASWARSAVWRDGLALWDDVIAKHPGIPLVLYNRGNEHAERGEQAAAIADYDAALNGNPELAQAWANRGVAKAALGDIAGALADYDEAIRRDPSNPTYRFDRGLALGDAGRWSEALAGLGDAIRLKPDFAEAYLNRGLALAQIDRAAEGALDVRRAQELGYPVDGATLERFGLGPGGATKDRGSRRE